MKFNVKDKSLNTFFGFKEGSDSIGRSMSPYHLMQDVIILPNKPDLDGKEEILFELEDRSAASNKPLINSYTYKIEKYDDVSIKLTLINFQIQPQ